MEADTALTDAHVAFLVQRAYDEMDPPVSHRKRPSTMSAFLSPDRKIVVLCSSLKKLEGNLGPRDYVKSNPQLGPLLDVVSNQLGGWHRNGGACGEIMTLNVWTRSQFGGGDLSGRVIYYNPSWDWAPRPRGQRPDRLSLVTACPLGAHLTITLTSRWGYYWFDGVCGLVGLNY
jgi:hypothetical protein